MGNLLYNKRVFQQYCKLKFKTNKLYLNKYHWKMTEIYKDY